MNGVEEKHFEVRDADEQIRLFGPGERHLKRLKEFFRIHLTARNGVVRLQGEPSGVQMAQKALHRMRETADAAQGLSESDVDFILNKLHEGTEISGFEPVPLLDRGRMLRPKTAGQAAYLKLMQQNDIVICTGPAGTGKTYLAAAMALNALGAGRIKKMVLARPAVEAGEKLGFLPGDLYEKVNPYLRPLYDAFEDLMEFGKVEKLLQRGVLEVVPIAFMRGRTLDHAYVVLDEAQNTTVKQMKMFLTRLGARSKAVVTGDITQIDLPPGEISGLSDALDTLQGIPGIGFCRLEEKDIVRHPLVQKIVDAYERRTQPNGLPATP